MVKRRSGYGTLIPGLLLLAGILVVFGTTGLWAMNNNQDMGPWLLMAALTVGALLLLLGALWVALPRFRAGAAAGGPRSADSQTDKQDELLRTIQVINRNLDQAVGQVRTRLSGAVQVSDDRGPIQRKVTDAETSSSEEKKKPRIH